MSAPVTQSAPGRHAAPGAAPVLARGTLRFPGASPPDPRVPQSQRVAVQAGVTFATWKPATPFPVTLCPVSLMNV